MSPEAAAAIEAAYLIAVGVTVLCGLGFFVWLVAGEIRDRGRRDADQNRR